MGDGGAIDLGISRFATVYEEMYNPRRSKKHGSNLLNEIESELDILRGNQSIEMEDTDLWKRVSGYKDVFSTHETWKLLREE